MAGILLQSCDFPEVALFMNIRFQTVMIFSGTIAVLADLRDLWNEEGVKPVIFLKNPVKEVTLSKPTEKQTSVTGMPVCNNSLAFLILTILRYW